jgi:hypothetical protein
MRNALLRHFNVCCLHCHAWNETKFIFASSSSIGDGDIDFDCDKGLAAQLKYEKECITLLACLSGLLQNGDGRKCGGAMGKNRAKL